MSYRINLVYAYEILSLLKPPRGSEAVGKEITGLGMYQPMTVDARAVADAWDTMLQELRHHLESRCRREKNPAARVYIEQGRAQALLEANGMRLAAEVISTMPAEDFDTLWDEVHAERRRRRAEEKAAMAEGVAI